VGSLNSPPSARESVVIDEFDDDEASRVVVAISEVAKQIQEFTMSADKYFGLATTTIVATVGLAVSQKLPAALVALPFALGGILLYVVQLFTERSARMGIRGFLEDRLRQTKGYWYANQNACLSAAVSQERHSVRVSTALYAVTYFGSCLISVRAASKIEAVPGIPLAVIVSVALLSLSAALIISMRELTRAYATAYQHMQNSYDGRSA
jgi:hypothetical protein